MTSTLVLISLLVAVGPGFCHKGYFNLRHVASNLVLRAKGNDVVLASSCNNPDDTNDDWEIDANLGGKHIINLGTGKYLSAMLLACAPPEIYGDVKLSKNKDDGDDDWFSTIWKYTHNSTLLSSAWDYSYGIRVPKNAKPGDEVYLGVASSYDTFSLEPLGSISGAHPKLTPNKS